MTAIRLFLEAAVATTPETRIEQQSCLISRLWPMTDLICCNLIPLAQPPAQPIPVISHQG